MNARKAFAVVVSTGILAVQLWNILPPGWPARYWYWPFLDYPMYSDARYRGDFFVQHRLAGIPCDEGETVRLIDAEDLRVVGFYLLYLLRDISAQVSADRTFATFISPVGTAEARERLDAAVELQMPGSFCRLKIQEQAFAVAEPVPVEPERVWTDLVEWELLPRGRRER